MRVTTANVPLVKGGRTSYRTWPYEWEKINRWRKQYGKGQKTTVGRGEYD